MLQLRRCPASVAKVQGRPGEQRTAAESIATADVFALKQSILTGPSSLALMRYCSPRTAGVLELRPGCEPRRRPERWGNCIPEVGPKSIWTAMRPVERLFVPTRYDYERTSRHPEPRFRSRNEE